MMRVTAFRARSAGSSRRRRWIASPRRDCATRSSLLCALLADAGGANHRAQPSLVGTASAVSWPPASRATIPSSVRRTAPSARSCAATAMTPPVRKEPQHSGLSRKRVGAVRPMAVGVGFDYFYGFMGGESDQCTLTCFAIIPRFSRGSASPVTNLITDMADDAIRHISAVNASAPNKPFFCYYVPGATIRRTTQPRNGSRSSKASLTWAMKSCARKSSPTRSG